MWTRVAEVAEHSRLPIAEMVEFAIKHEAKYGIINTETHPMVGTWYCNDLVRDFRKVSLG
jgi:hypothetical protein